MVLHLKITTATVNFFKSKVQNFLTKFKNNHELPVTHAIDTPICPRFTN